MIRIHSINPKKDLVPIKRLVIIEFFSGRTKATVKNDSLSSIKITNITRPDGERTNFLDEQERRNIANRINSRLISAFPAVFFEVTVK